MGNALERPNFEKALKNERFRSVLSHFYYLVKKLSIFNVKLLKYKANSLTLDLIVKDLYSQKHKSKIKKALYSHLSVK